jgi:hypothetical protein
MALQATRSTIGGTSVLMAGSTAKLVALMGLSVTSAIIHPAFVAVGVALMLYGLWRTNRQSALVAAAAFGVLSIAALLTPASVMTTGAMSGESMHTHAGLPWNGAQMVGAALYLVGGVTLAYALWRAYPSPKPTASATAMGGMVLATGCTACCMVTGAVAGMAITFGVTARYVETLPFVFWTGLTITAIGLYRLAGWRPMLFVLLGGLITPAGKIAYRLLPPALDLGGIWRVHGVDMVFVPKYFTYFAGALVILYGFVVAYRAATATEAVPVRVAPSTAEEPIGAD